MPASERVAPALTQEQLLDQVARAYSPMMSQEHIEIVRRCIQLFNSRDLAHALELVDPDVELDLSRNIFNPDIYHGHAGIERWRNAVDDVWDDFHGTVEDLIDADNKVVGAFTMAGKGRESGVEVTMRIFSIWTFRGSKIVKVVGGYRDRTEVLEAAGLTDDAPAEAP